MKNSLALSQRGGNWGIHLLASPIEKRTDMLKKVRTSRMDLNRTIAAQMESLDRTIAIQMDSMADPTAGNMPAGGGLDELYRGGAPGCSCSISLGLAAGKMAAPQHHGRRWVIRFTLTHPAAGDTICCF